MDLYEKIIGALEQYSKGSMLEDIYGLSETADYDAVVIAPAWVPEKIFSRYHAVVIPKKRGAYFAGYEVGVQGKKFGWIQTSSSAGNVIDAMFTLAKSRCQTILFVGAVGALKPESCLGEIVTPSCSISGDGGSLYLQERLSAEHFLNEIAPIRRIFSGCGLRQKSWASPFRRGRCTAPTASPANIFIWMKF